MFGGATNIPADTFSGGLGATLDAQGIFFFVLLTLSCARKKKHGGLTQPRPLQNPLPNLAQAETGDIVQAVWF